MGVEDCSDKAVALDTEGVFNAVFKTLVAAIEEDEGECILKVEL